MAGFAAVAAGLFAQPAMAAMARVDVRATPGGPIAQLVYRAAPGEVNRVEVDLERAEGRPSAYLLRPAANTAAGSGCAPASGGDNLRCPIPEGARTTGPLLDLGDRNDYAEVTSLLHFGAVMLGGPGHDLLAGGGRFDGAAGDDSLQVRSQGPADLNGGPGGDSLFGGPGADVLDPGPGNDQVFSGGGDDRVRAVDRGSDLISCDGGRDRAVLDGFDLPYGFDRPGHGCERIARRSPPRAIPIGFEDDSYAPKEWSVGIGCPTDMPRACLVRATVSLPGGRTLGRTRRVRIPPGGARSLGLGYNSNGAEDRLLERRGARVRVETILRRGRSRVYTGTVPANAAPHDGD